MKVALQIARREWRIALSGPAFYVLGAIFGALSGYFFFDDLFMVDRAEVRALTDPLQLFVLATLLPALGMRALAEERRAGTDELLLTFPVEPWQVVVGKLVAAWGLALVLVALTLPYGAVVASTGDLDWGAAAGTWLGLSLVALLFVSLSVLASSWTSSQVVAFVVGWFLCFGLFVAGWVVDRLPPGASLVAAAVGVGPHLQSFARGAPDSRDLVWFLSLVGAAGVLATLSFSLRTRAQRASAVVVAGSVAICVVLLNLIAGKLPAHLDWTEEGLHTVTPVTARILRELPEPLVVDAYVSADLPSGFRTFPRDFADLLTQLQEAAPDRFQWTLRDPTGDPTLADEAARLGIPGVPFDRNVDDKVVSVTHYLGYRVSLGDKSAVVPIVVRPQDTEYELVSLAVRLSRDEQPVVGILTGDVHARAPNGLVKTAGVLGENFDVRFLDPAAAIPEDVDGVIEVGPLRPLESGTVKNLAAYLERGGGVALFLNQVATDVRAFRAIDRPSGLESWLQGLGIQLGADLVQSGESERIEVPVMQGGVKTVQRTPYHSFVQVENSDDGHPVSRGVGRVVMPFASSVTLGAPPEGLAGRTILSTGQKTWLLKAPYRVHPLNDHVHGDLVGPKGLAVALEGSFPGGTASGRLLVVGDADLVTDHYMSTISKVLLLNTADWLVGSADLQSIRVRGSAERTLSDPSEEWRSRARWGGIVGPPLGLALLGALVGGLVWRGRRRATLP